MYTTASELASSMISACILIVSALFCCFSQTQNAYLQCLHSHSILHSIFFAIFFSIIIHFRTFKRTLVSS